MSLLVYLILLLAGVLAALLYYSWERLVAFFGAAYPNARYSAMGNEFITRSGISRVLGAGGFQEAVSTASNRDIPLQETDMDLIEAEIDSLMVKNLEMVREEMPAPSRAFFDALILRREIHVLKRILRAMFAGREWNAEPVGHLDSRTLSLLKEEEELSNIHYILRYTPYHDIVEKEFENGVPEIAVLERALDDFYFDYLRETVGKMRVWKRAYREFMSISADIQNIKTALRLHEMGMEFSEEELVPGGKGIGVWELQQMTAAEAVQDALRQLQAGHYEVQAENIFDAERELDKKFLELIHDLAIKYISTAGPSLYFLQAREFELRNLRAVFRGLHEGLPVPEIEKELVTVE